MSAAARPSPELLSYLDDHAEPRIVMDADYRIIAANRAYSREIARGRPVKGRHCYEVSHRYTVPCDQAGESCPLRMSQESGQVERVLHLHHTPRGEEHVDVETAPVRNQRGAVIYFVETLRVLKQASSRATAEGLVGRSPRFNSMLSLVLRVAPTDAAVLLQGETGTGKEVVAAIIHETSKRAPEPFVVVDCSGLTETLFESELFGYEKGAFTGATQRKTGLVEAASGGTLFLDEVGDIPLPLQVKLLRLLESGTYRRVGGIDTLRSDFRLICATHRDLLQMVEAGSFRRDLYFRISTFPITVPSLAERREDIPLLAAAFLKRVAGGRDLHFSRAAVAALQSRSYAGNIRELRNLVERATILADGSEIAAVHFAAEEPPRSVVTPVAERESGFLLDQAIPLEELERRYLAWVVNRFPGAREALAQRLGVGTRTLYRKLSSVARAGPAAKSKASRSKRKAQRNSLK